MLEQSHMAGDTHGRLALLNGNGKSSVDQSGCDTQGSPVVDDLPYARLQVMADLLDDLEHTKQANKNRHQSFTSTWKVDGKLYGKGFAVSDPAAVDLLIATTQLQELEDAATRNLEKTMRKHPLGPWARRKKGIGLKQAGRLLAVLRDPLWNEAEQRPRRGPAELWQYCGHGDPKRSHRRKGQPVEHNPKAKMRLNRIADSCTKFRCKACTAAGKLREGSAWAPPPENCTCIADGYVYRAVYDAARAHYLEKLHDEPCVRCGPSGNPALPGSPWSEAHKHAAALRRVGKEILKDLFQEAKIVRSCEELLASLRAETESSKLEQAMPQSTPTRRAPAQNPSTQKRRSRTS